MSWLLPPLAAWLLWGLVVFAAQRRMLFPGRTAAPLESGESLGGGRLHRIELADVSVEAWWLPPAAGTPRPVPAVLFTHGNMELVDEWVGSFGPLREAGAGVLLLEYPGYGRSTGLATERSVVAATVAAYDLLVSFEGEVDPRRIVAFGRSVGGGPASALTRFRPVAALVLNAAFTDVGAYARRYLLPAFLVRHPFDNLRAVGAFDGPVLIQHGTRDRTVPFSHGERLGAAARDGLVLRYECGHNDCPWSRMLDDVIDFLRGRGVLPD
jgi:pimeloyl-ACP methyl ester carboxylesterase